MHLETNFSLILNKTHAVKARILKKTPTREEKKEEEPASQLYHYYI